MNSPAISVVSPPVMTSNLWQLIIYFTAIIAITVTLLSCAYLFGQKHQAKTVDEPFESGIVSAGDAQLRFSVQFYLIAIFFVIFDMESVFLFAWSIAFQETGESGFFAACIFTIILIAALFYLWANDAFDWHTQTRPKTEIGSNDALDSY
jgi:NADH-quinone oxidoreductase subunit A